MTCVSTVGVQLEQVIEKYYGIRITSASKDRFCAFSASPASQDSASAGFFESGTAAFAG
jgi:hypothetical protein